MLLIPPNMLHAAYPCRVQKGYKEAGTAEDKEPDNRDGDSYGDGCNLGDGGGILFEKRGVEGETEAVPRRSTGSATEKYKNLVQVSHFCAAVCFISSRSQRSGLYPLAGWI